MGDLPAHVAANREGLHRRIGVTPVFMQQVHGVDVVDIDLHTPPGRSADACWTSQPGVACTIMVADCLPVLLAHPEGRWVAAAHAGWRGLAGWGQPGGHGVLESTLAHALRAGGDVGLHASDIHVWLGPCIGPQAFEVGPEVRAAFCQSDPMAAQAFTPSRSGTFLADLPGLARRRLKAAGLTSIHGNDSTFAWCTHSQESLFFSHRRDAAVRGSTGRMAACVWLEG